MGDIYTDGTYLESTQSWHMEDSSWKAQQIAQILGKNKVQLDLIAEVGCGAGRVISELSKLRSDTSAKYEGYDISPQAIELSREVESENLKFYCEDPLGRSDSPQFDLLMAIDVFEHVPDYLGFLNQCHAASRYKLYHIPLDIHVSAVLRGTVSQCRETLGHLHYFTAKTALSTLEDTGHKIIDYSYTNGALELTPPTFMAKRVLANIPRRMLGAINVSLAARLLGGYSLLVLAE